jgi:hypothetical protein
VLAVMVPDDAELMRLQSVFVMLHASERDA